jgi:hypothetical protein
LKTFLFDDIFYDPKNHASDMAEADQLLRVLATLPAAQQLPQHAAEDTLQHCLQYGLYFHNVLQPVQQLDVATVYRIMFEALDMYRWAMQSVF